MKKDTFCALASEMSLFSFFAACCLLRLAVAVLALGAVVLLDFAAQDWVVGYAKDHVEPDDMHDLEYVQKNVEQVICWKVAKVKWSPVGRQMQDSWFKVAKRGLKKNVEDWLTSWVWW